MFKRVLILKLLLLTTYIIIIVCKKCHIIAKCKFRKLFVSKGTFQWLLKCNQSFINPQGPNEYWVPSTFHWSCRINVFALWKEYVISFVEAQDVTGWHLLISLTLWQWARIVLPWRSIFSVMLIGKCVFIIINVFYPRSVRRYCVCWRGFIFNKTYSSTSN